MPRATYSPLYLAVALLFLPQPGGAYELQTSTVSKLKNGTGHEAMTVASYLCARSTDWSENKTCLNHPASKGFVKGDDQYREHPDSLTEKDRVWLGHLLEGVRWPDDPDRRFKSNLPVTGIASYSKCSDWLKGSYGPCGNRFCLSHFGPLQMLHAMRPSAPWCSPVSANAVCASARSDTRESIHQAIGWLADIAAGRISGTDPLFKHAFPARVFDQVNCSMYRDRRVSDIFFTNCHVPSLVGECFTTLYNPQLRARLQTIALGAILHTIQDSFSTSHTVRVGDEGVTCAARVTCTSVLGYHDYRDQDAGDHTKADKVPKWDPSCFAPDRSIDDPITAGARVLRLAFDAKPDTFSDEVWGYLSTRVFVEDRAQKGVLARARACFAREQQQQLQ